MAKKKTPGRARANGLGTVTFDKARGKWYARVLIGYAPDTGKPQFVKRYADSKTEADELLITLHTEKRTGRLSPSKKLTVSD